MSARTVTEAVQRDEPAAWAPPAVNDAAGGVRRVRTYEELDGAQGRAVFFRPHRFTAADLAPLEGIVRVGHGAEARECALRDVSQNGVAFECPGGEKLRHGQPLRLSLRFDGRELWRGDARVSAVRERDGLVAASFENGLVDTDELLQLRDLSRWDGGPLRADEKPWHARGHESFKSLVSELRLFLEDAEQRLGDLEAMLPWHVMQDPASLARNVLVQRLRVEIGTDVRRFAAEIDAARRESGPDEPPALREFSRRLVDRFLMQVPWMHRARYKPFGYPGDYELMNFFYEKDFEGPTLLARAVGHAFIQTPCAMAVVYRKDLMKRQLRAIVQQAAGPTHPIRILSIAAGPARELQELLLEIEDLPGPLEIVLFEQDKGALAHAYRRLRPLADRRFPGQVRITFLNESIKRLLRDKNLFAEFGGFDAIYSCGLFDYLQDVTAIRLARNLCIAAPAGKVFIANMVDHAGRWFVEYHLDWQLLYRTRKELVEIGHRAAPGWRVRLLEEETGINPFIELVRA
jgi:hypothetical protein